MSKAWRLGQVSAQMKRIRWLELRHKEYVQARDQLRWERPAPAELAGWERERGAQPGAAEALRSLPPPPPEGS